MQADAFCQAMVRSLVGAMLVAGDGRRPVGGRPRCSTRRERSSEVTVAPAHGLTLVAVGYPADPAEYAHRADPHPPVAGPGRGLTVRGSVARQARQSPWFALLAGRCRRRLRGGATVGPALQHAPAEVQLDHVEQDLADLGVTRLDRRPVLADHQRVRQVVASDLPADACRSAGQDFGAVAVVGGEATETALPIVEQLPEPVSGSFRADLVGEVEQAGGDQVASSGVLSVARTTWLQPSRTSRSATSSVAATAQLPLDQTPAFLSYHDCQNRRVLDGRFTASNSPIARVEQLRRAKVFPLHSLVRVVLGKNDHSLKETHLASSPERKAAK